MNNLSIEHLKKMRERYLWNGVSEVTVVLDELIAIRELKGEQVPVAFTGSGSLAAIKVGHEGHIWSTPADAHPVPLYDRPQKPTPEQLIEWLEGMEVSVDVSTCDADHGNRLFGKVTEVSELDGAKNGVILLVQDAEANFTARQKPVVPVGFLFVVKATGAVIYSIADAAIEGTHLIGQIYGDAAIEAAGGVVKDGE